MTASSIPVHMPDGSHEEWEIELHPGVTVVNGELKVSAQIFLLGFEAYPIATFPVRYFTERPGLGCVVSGGRLPKIEETAVSPIRLRYD